MAQVGVAFALEDCEAPPENGTTRSLMYISGVMYFIVVPSVYLMNSSEVKSVILDNKIYIAFVNLFYPRINQIVPASNDNAALHYQNSLNGGLCTSNQSKCVTEKFGSCINRVN